MNKFQKGTVLLNQGRFEDALSVFNELTHLVPNEAPLYLQIGKIQKKLGRQDLALQAYQRALDLDPKDNNMVKNLIENINNSMDQSDDEDFD